MMLVIGGDGAWLTPAIDLAFVAAHERGDVLLHDGRQGRFVSDGRHVAGELRVPDSGVPSDEDLVVGGELD